MKSSIALSAKLIGRGSEPLLRLTVGSKKIKILKLQQFTFSLHFLGYMFGYEDNLACFKPSDGKTDTNLISYDDDADEDDWDGWEVEEEEKEEEEAVAPSSKCMWGLVKHLITIERQTEIR